MSLISMHWHTYIRHENGSLLKKKKPEISTNRESNSANHDRSIAPHGVGSRGLLKGPWWGSRGRSPPKLLGFSRFGGPARPFSEGIK